MGAASHSAAVFSVGNAVCGLVVSAVMDLAGRRAFMWELRMRGKAAGGQGQGQGQQRSGLRHGHPQRQPGARGELGTATSDDEQGPGKCTKEMEAASGGGTEGGGEHGSLCGGAARMAARIAGVAGGVTGGVALVRDG